MFGPKMVLKRMSAIAGVVTMSTLEWTTSLVHQFYVVTQVTFQVEGLIALVAFVFPAIMFKEAKRRHGKGTWAENLEVGFVMVSMILMVLVGLIGVVASIALDA